MELSTPKEVIAALIPVLSDKEKQEIRAYFTVYDKYQEEFSVLATEDLKKDPVFAKLILGVPKEISEARNKISRELQKDAIENDNWKPYVIYQIEQGITYAKMNIPFKSWYKVIALFRNYIVPYLRKEYGTGEEFIGAVSGLNRFMDIAMGIIGEAYMEEKRSIINEDQKKLEKSEGLFRGLMEQNADMITLALPEGKLLYISPSVTRILGFTFEEYSSKPAHHFIHPEDVGGLMNGIMGIINTPGKSFFRQQRLLHKDGSYRWCEGSMTNMLHDPAIGAIVSNFRDITERKKAEDELKTLNESLELKVIERTEKIEQSGLIIKEREEKYRALFNSIDEGYCIIEVLFDKNNKPVDYVFLEINESFEKQTGLVDAVGKRMREFAPNHEEHWFEIYGKIAITGEPIRFENRAEQLHRWYDVYAFRYGDPEKRQVAILFNDITERKRSEKIIIQLNKDLESNIQQLESVNKELEAFTYSVSHDLRAPLRAISGYSEILSEDYQSRLDEEGKRILGNISYNAIKMGTLIDQLLTFSRLGRKEIQLSSVDMNDLAEGVVAEIQKTTPHRAKIMVAKLPKVNSDYGLLYQVMFNLVANAIKYSSKKDTPLVEISSENTANEIIFRVKDNGAGFDMKYYTKLFGVFQRLHSDEDFQGTGVGLAIVQRIIAKHGGKVWAEGKVNEGAIFSFSIPKSN